MIELIWHGRGGQGAFTAAKLLGAAFALKQLEHYALSFPSFGPERRGAPIRAFTKLDTQAIGNRSEIEQADYLVFLDDTLYSDESLSTLKADGKILLNTKKNVNHPQIITLDGDTLATEILQLAITNTVMLGALAALIDELALEDVERAIRDSLPARIQEKNIAAARAAYKSLEDKHETLFKR